MRLSEEMAVRLHRMMWSDMQKELGDDPSAEARKDFKFEWIRTNFPGEEHIMNNCFLCEYAKTPWAGSEACQKCPIRWPGDTCCPPTIDAGVHYAASPISKILELPDRRTGVRYIANNKAKTIDVTSYYKFREGLLSMASGLPASSAINDHIEAIRKQAVENDNAQKASIFNALAETSDAFKQYAEEQKASIFKELAKESGLDPTATLDSHIKAIANKARDEGYDVAKEYLAECSGVDQNELIFDHIRAIKEKAVEEYFEKQPAAKMVSMDVDNAFKQYADEQKTPIFKALSKASGLSENNQSVYSHIEWIKNKTRQEVQHAAEEEKASHEKDLEILRKTCMQQADKLDKYKDALSKESDLDRNRPVDDHIREIVKNSMEAGATEELERIQSKIEELLS